jgi:hypothetical protein
MIAAIVACMALDQCRLCNRNVLAEGMRACGEVQVWFEQVAEMNSIGACQMTARIGHCSNCAEGVSPLLKRNNKRDHAAIWDR